MILNNKESFYSMFYILDEVYQNENSDDLGAILGIMNPELLVDYEIVDSAIYDDWEEFIKNKLVNGNNLINLVEKFINEYANDFGFDISRSMKILKTNIKQEKILQCIQSCLLYTYPSPRDVEESRCE